MAIAPGIIGSQAEVYYQQLQTELQKARNITIVQSSYDRGWYGAIAKMDLTLELPVKTAKGKTITKIFELQSTSEITHGPLVTVGAGLAEIITVITGADSVFPEDYRADIHTQVSFGGSGTATIILPSAKLQLAENQQPMEFGGITGEVVFDDQMSEVRSQFSMPQLVVNNVDSKPLMVGDVELRTETNKSSSGLTMGGGYLQVGHMSIGNSDAGLDLSLIKLRLDASSAESMGSVSTNIIYSFDEFKVNEETYGPAELNFELSRLPADALLKMQQGLEAVNAQALSEAQKGMAVMSVLMGHAPAMLQGDPKLSISKLSLMTPDGEVNGDLMLQAVGLNWAEITNPATILGKLVGEASVQIPEVLLLELLEKQARQQYQTLQQRRLKEGLTAVDPKKAEPDFEQQSKQLLALWMRQQFAVRNGANISSVAVLSQGLLTVNGKTIPLAGK